MLANVSLRWRGEAALTVVMCGKGYPGTPEKGGVIDGIADAEAMAGVLVFHAGTTERDGKVFANGGRVLNLVGVGSSVREARSRAYAAVDAIQWDDGFCRRDIGWRALETG